MMEPRRGSYDRLDPKGKVRIVNPKGVLCARSDAAIPFAWQCALEKASTGFRRLLHSVRNDEALQTRNARHSKKTTVIPAQAGIS